MRAVPLALAALAVLAASPLRAQDEPAGAPAPAAEHAAPPQQPADEPVERKGPSVSAGSGGFGIESGDGEFQVRFRGYAHVDGRFFPGDGDTGPGVDTFLLRRVRPVLQGTLARHFDFRIMPDFGRGAVDLLDAYVDVSYSRRARLRIGKFKSPLGLERLQSRTALSFVELSYPTYVVPNRDVGIQLEGDLGGGVVSYAAGVFNGAPDGASSNADTGDGKDVAGRIFVSPWKRGDGALRGLGIGVAGSWGEQSGPLPSYRSAGQLGIISTVTGVEADGARTRVVPQGSFYAGPFGVIAEYARSESFVRKPDETRERLDAKAWQATVTVALTGEKASFDGLHPSPPFDPGGGQWGALELAVRVEGIELGREAVEGGLIDPVKSVREAFSWTAAITWHLNRNAKQVFDFTRTTFTGGAPSGADRPAESALFFRTQLSF